MDMKVVNIDKSDLSESEKETVDRIGIQNLDYCVAAIVQDRHPDREFIYFEDENSFEVDGETFELDFEITAEDPNYEVVSKHVQTLELLLDDS